MGRPPSCTCGTCFKCKRAAYMREWWRSKPIEHRRRLIAGRDPEKVREQDRRKQARRRREGTPEQKMKIAARAAVQRARERGDLKPGPCETCGATDTHAHHDDYTKPLEVRWFCRPCHDELHRQMNDMAAAA